MVSHAQYKRSMFAEIDTLSLVLKILLVLILDKHTEDTEAHWSHMLYTCQHKIIMQTYGAFILIFCLHTLTLVFTGRAMIIRKAIYSNALLSFFVYRMAVLKLLIQS